ncbi:DUF4265 domain-containing protein [Nonomuraea sp. NPDC050663]|uniref:DUF4265 domain-containing protein n=1 Tax=Nonomuraea sp. NPDC050663 TaxID=3364370 RepID=UPI0037B24A9C
MAYLGAEYIVHKVPAMAGPQNYIARVNLEPFGFPGSFEQMWLTPLGGDAYEVACIPFRAYGLALGDIVSISPDGSEIHAIVRPSGRRVLRLFFRESLESKDLRRVTKKLEKDIEDATLLAEWSGNRHVAIDVPSHAVLESLFSVVAGHVQRGHAFWEWADDESFTPSHGKPETG